jgi:ethanolamine utilization protein EutA (predicted chaperonin)
MKVKLETFANGDLLIRLPLQVIDLLKLKLGDTIDLDAPMVGGGLTIHRVDQRVGDEVI